MMLTSRQSRDQSHRKVPSNVESRARERFHECLPRRRLELYQISVFPFYEVQMVCN